MKPALKHLSMLGHGGFRPLAYAELGPPNDPAQSEIVRNFPLLQAGAPGKRSPDWPPAARLRPTETSLS